MCQELPLSLSVTLLHQLTDWLTDNDKVSGADWTFDTHRQATNQPTEVSIVRAELIFQTPSRNRVSQG